MVDHNSSHYLYIILCCASFVFLCRTDSCVACISRMKGSSAADGRATTKFVSVGGLTKCGLERQFWSDIKGRRHLCHAIFLSWVII